MRFIVTVISNLQLLKQHMVGPLNFDDPYVKKWSLQIYDVVTEGDFSPWVNDLITDDESWSQLIWKARLCDNLLDFLATIFYEAFVEHKTIFRGARDRYRSGWKDLATIAEQISNHYELHAAFSSYPLDEYLTSLRANVGSRIRIDGSRSKTSVESVCQCGAVFFDCQACGAHNCYCCGRLIPDHQSSQ